MQNSAYGEQKKQPGIMVYFETLSLMRSLSDQEVGSLIRNAARYVHGISTPRGLSENAELFWPIVRRETEKDMVRYQAKCRRNPRGTKVDVYIPYDPKYDPTMDPEEQTNEPRNAVKW